MATIADMMPTKIEVSEPLTVFAMMSRPHLSPPKGSVALRASAAAGSAAAPPFDARMSAITSASGSTLLPSDGAAGAEGAAGFAPFSSAITSASGSTIDEGTSAPGDAVSGAAGTAGAPASTSAPRKLGGA